MKGKIIKGIAGFYYVHGRDQIVYECKAKGIFRNRRIKPFVGDDVEIDILSREERTGNIIQVEERKNQLIRPAVANIDQAMVVFAAASPEPNLNLLDRFLISMQRQQVETVVCFNKRDIASVEMEHGLEKTYADCGYEVLFVSALQNDGLEEIRRRLAGKTTALAGPSGVGKSTITNWLYPEAKMEIGEISRKLERGKHTTRHSELIYVGKETYLMDTPGFSSLYLENMNKEELKEYFGEFDTYQEECRFQGCTHIHEPGCEVKRALEAGFISPVRYENYCLLYEELKQQKKY